MRLCLAIAALMLLSGCESAQSDKTDKADRQVGRYVIALSNDQLGRAILLDTATGETWYQQSTGPSVIADVSQWLPMDKTTLREWNQLNRPEPTAAAAENSN